MNRITKIFAAVFLVALVAMIAAIAVGPDQVTDFAASLFSGSATFAAIRVKSIDSLKKKYEANASSATGAFVEGVNNPRRSQAESAIAAKDTYAQAVQEAIADDRFAKGVEEAGDAAWKEGATTLGKDRYAGGVRAGSDDWAKGTKPVIDAMAAVDLPPKGVKGDPANLERVRLMNEAARSASRS